MREITVPIDCNDFRKFGGKEKMLNELKRLNPKRVLVATGVIPGEGVIPGDEASWNGIFHTLKEITEILHKEGYEVGAWSEGTWIEGSINEKLVQMKGINGWSAGVHPCFLDKNFSEYVGKFVEGLARCGVDLILFDDDYKYGYWGTEDWSICCLCELHLKFIEEELGEKLTAEELQKKVTTGGKNKYRSAWLKANGTGIRNHSKILREHLNKVNPKCRMGVCSEMSLWDYSGVDTVEVANILAGDTKPFMRLIGAPYWAVKRSIGNSRLQHVIELERMERSWCEGNDNVEIICEGDVYPRPRTATPSSYLEIFDTALMAEGKFDGILKYCLDYTSVIDNEKGYTDNHVRNLPLYDKIDKAFKDKEPVGVRIYEEKNKIENMKFTPEMENNGKVEQVFYSPAAKMMSDASVPTTYYGEGEASVAFGENIKYVPESAFKKGMIIDLAAAEILMQKGIDVGIEEIGEVNKPNFEYYLEDNNELWLQLSGLKAYKTKLNKNAKVISVFSSNSKYGEILNDSFPASFMYQNKNGNKFLVFTFNAYLNGEGMNRQYERSKAIANAVKWFNGKGLSAYSYKNPDLYILAKKNKDESEMAVGLWNIFADSIYEPKVELNDNYSQIEFINCTGKLEGNKVLLSEIPPFKFAGFTVKK